MFVKLMDVCQEYQVWLLYYFKLTATVVRKLKQFGVFAVKMLKKITFWLQPVNLYVFLFACNNSTTTEQTLQTLICFLEILLNFVSMFEFHKHGVHIADTENLHVFLCALLKLSVR
jgi:hypothetical protein